jgi:GntR family transcriptional repressor for pyruvate dehydrogenase complex
MESSDAGHAAVVEADLQFHRTIFQMAENRVCSLMFSIVHESLHKLMEITSQLVDLEHTLRLHHRIYTAIKKGDPGEARARMFAHLTDAKELLIRSNAARIQTELGDRFSRYSLAGPPRRRPARRPSAG